MTDQNAAVKTGAWSAGEGDSEADARRPRTAGGAESRWMVQRQVTAGYSSWQISGRLLQRKPRLTCFRRTFGSRSSPGKLKLTYLIAAWKRVDVNSNICSNAATGNCLI